MFRVGCMMHASLHFSTPGWSVGSNKCFYESSKIKLNINLQPPRAARGSYIDAPGIFAVLRLERELEMVSNFLIVWFLGAKNGRMHQQKYFWIFNLRSMSYPWTLQKFFSSRNQIVMKAQLKLSSLFPCLAPHLSSHVSRVPCAAARMNHYWHIVDTNGRTQD